MTDGVPVCVDEDGHAWVTGAAAELEGGGFEITSRQCRRCGYIDELDNEERFAMIPTDKNQNSERGPE